jgi:hypothetical protein
MSERLAQSLLLGGLILLLVIGVQAEALEDPICMKTSNWWNAASRSCAHGLTLTPRFFMRLAMGARKTNAAMITRVLSTVVFRIYGPPIIAAHFWSSERSFQAWNIAVFRKCSARICSQMALDFAQERLAKTFQFLFAYSGNAAELG